jgi:Mrp family chromosome partitioning ATPase
MRDNIKVKETNLKPKVAEIYKMLQIRLNTVINIKNIKVISFTSVSKYEEKSAHICNIAKSMVLEGKKVLIVDCNNDNLSIQRYLGIKNEVVSDKEKAHEDGDHIICYVPDLPGLNFVPVGQLLKDSDNNLDIGKITAFIEEVKPNYDVVFLDSPPAGIVTEGIKLSLIADGTILIVQSGETPKASAKRVKEMLDAVNANVIGVILED